MTKGFALAYAGLAALPMIMHLGLALGAPWGQYSVGGQFDDVLPPLWRGLAVAQAGLLMLMAATVLDRAEVLSLGLPKVLFWLVLGLSALTCLANWATPSTVERLLWGPVTSLMLVSALVVAKR